MANQNGIESVALPVPSPASTPSGSQDFNKPLSSKVEYNSHDLSRWGTNSETMQNPGNPMDIVETCVDEVYTPNLNPSLAPQAAPGSEIYSCAWDEKPI